MSKSDPSILTFEALAAEVIQRCEVAVGEAGEPSVPEKQISELMMALIRVIAERAQSGAPMLIMSGNKTLTATDAVIAATTILESARIEVFELAAWQANTSIGSVKRQRMANLNRTAIS